MQSLECSSSLASSFGCRSLFDEHSDGAKEAVLVYRAIERRGETTLVEIELKTGRKHQIRSQLAFIGHPVMGDKLYGSKMQYRTGEIALMATKLEFPHPVRKETILLEINDDGFNCK